MVKVRSIGSAMVTLGEAETEGEDEGLGYCATVGVGVGVGQLLSTTQSGTGEPLGLALAGYEGDGELTLCEVRSALSADQIASFIPPQSSTTTITPITPAAVQR